jgi:hypothetical protein
MKACLLGRESPVLEDAQRKMICIWKTVKGALGIRTEERYGQKRKMTTWVERWRLTPQALPIPQLRPLSSSALVRRPEQALQTAPAQIERRFRYYREFPFLQLEAQAEIVVF